jgi:ribosomal-protein-alanine N-acetyltransferase
MVWLNVIAISIESTTVGGPSATMHDIPMSDVEVLNGPRVTLRAPTLDDAGPLFERMASDPDVSRYMSWRPHPDADETRRVISDVFNVGGETTWLIELRDGGGPIGLCGWRRPQPHTIDFGYCLGRRWWRRGLMSEAVQLLLDKAQRDPTVYRVRRTATSTTPHPRRCWNAADWPSKDGWRATPYCPTSATSHRTACCSAKRSGDDAAHRPRARPQCKIRIAQTLSQS